MLQLFTIWLGTIAFLASTLTIGFGLYAESRRDIQHMIDVVGGLVSAFLWFVTAFGAQGMEVVSNGEVLAEPVPAVGLLFVGFGVFMLGVAVVGTGFLFNVFDLVDEPAR